MISTVAPAALSVSRGTSSSDCSKPLVARMAIFFPDSSIRVSVDGEVMLINRMILHLVPHRQSCAFSSAASALQSRQTQYREDELVTEGPLFHDIIRRRRSVRKFESGRSVGRDVLERIVDCGRWAPS